MGVCTPSIRRGCISAIRYENSHRVARDQARTAMRTHDAGTNTHPIGMQSEAELVDGFRDFVKARAKLDLEYAQSLQRLAQSHLAKLADKQTDGDHTYVSLPSPKRPVLDRGVRACSHSPSSCVPP